MNFITKHHRVEVYRTHPYDYDDSFDDSSFAEQTL